MPETKVTTLTTSKPITEIKGTCPQCGGPLELKPRVYAWNPDGSPSKEDTFNEIYCPACKKFWLGEC